MALLEDVLVPVYLFHRYQVEAVTKVIGGQQYSYAVRGDGQLVTKPVSGEEQKKALDAVLDCLEPKFLALPQRITKLIPPRPAGYDYNRELFKRRTSLSFDPLAAAETAADLPLSFLFNTARLNRLAQAEESGLTLSDVLKEVVRRTWQAPRQTGLEGLIQEQNGQLVLTYLLAVSNSDDASFATKAAVMKAIDELKAFAMAKAKTEKGNKGWYLLALDRIKAPEKAKPTQHVVTPPGAPIGDLQLGCTDEQ